MAKGKTVTVKVVVNNNPVAVAPTSQVLEPIVVNDQLVADNKDANPGVNSLFMKN